MTSLDEYEEPWVKILGIMLIWALILGGIWWYILHQIDNQRDVCPHTKEYMTLRECKEER
jgi:hypothetical protein